MNGCCLQDAYMTFYLILRVHGDSFHAGKFLVVIDRVAD